MRTRFTPQRTRITGVAAVTLLVVMLAACSDQSGADSYGGADYSSSEAMSDLAAADRDAELAEGSVASASAASAARSVISTGSITVEVAEPKQAAEEAAQLAATLGGRVESESLGSSGAGGGTDFAELSIRVPADRFDQALAQLGEIGKVLDQNRNANDVTLEHVDLQARVEALQASVDRLNKLIAAAETTSELIEAEGALTERQAELDSLTGQLQQLETQVNESTIWVTLTTKQALPGGPANFWEGLLAGLQSIAAAASGGLVILGVLLPWLVLLGGIALATVLLIRSRRNRSKRDNTNE